MPTNGTRRTAVGLTALIASGFIASGLVGLWSAGPAGAAGTPTLVASPDVLSPDATSTVTVTGANYLVPPHAAGADVFGGVYVFFGWARPGGPWGPSARNSIDDSGQFGTTYTYPGSDGGADTRDDGSGLVRLVSFTAGGLSGTATDFHMDDNGNWSTTLVVHGATFSWTDPVTGQPHPVDCRLVQCGIYTIGAHGKASATNEVFAPITFANGTAPSGGSSSPSGGTAPSGGASSASTSGASAATAGPATAVKGATATKGSAAPTTRPPVAGAVTTTVPVATTVPADGATTTLDPATVSTLVGSPTTIRSGPSSDEQAASVRIPQDDGGGGGGGWAWGGGIGGAVVAAGAGGTFWLRRRRPA